MANYAKKIDYLDPDTGSSQYGYIIGDKTYKDEAGKQRVSEGAIVTGDDGRQWKMGADGNGNLFDGTLAGMGISRSTVGGASRGNAQDTQNSYIEDMYAAQAEANRRALDAAYQANVNSINAAAAKIPQQYQMARNSVASQSEVQKANFNEYAAANGLNSGAGGQATLAMGNQLQSNLSGLTQSEANAQADLELQRTQLTTAYQNDIAKAIADGNFQKAQTLYDDYQRRSVEAINQKRYDAEWAAQADETTYSRALQAAAASGIYDGMAAFGWKPELIAAVNAASKRV